MLLIKMFFKHFILNIDVGKYSSELLKYYSTYIKVFHFSGTK